MDSSNDVLKFIVTGGGIAGLTCAYLLKEAGHGVVILEKSLRDEQLSARDGGVRIPPNMTRLLQELPGTEKLLNTRATKGAGIVFHQCNGDDPAERVGKMVFAEEIMNDLGSDFYFMPHRDLHDHLYELCICAGIEIRHGFEVREIITSTRSSSDSGPTIVGKSGEHIIGDIVIGACGKNSVARKVLLAEEDEAEGSDCTSSPNKPCTLPPIKALTGATLAIPASLVRSDPEFTSLLKDQNHWMVFMGNGTSIAIAQYGPDLYTLDLTYGKPPDPEDEDDEWLSSGKPVDKVLKKIEEYDPRIKRLIELGSDRSHWNIQVVHNLSQYVSESYDLVVIGDAAHSIYINGTQNTAAALEDAFTLGRLFSRLPSLRESKNMAPLLLNGYQQIQQKRTTALEINGMDTMLVLALEGPEREGRNNGFRLTLTLDGIDDAVLEHIWSDYVMQFNYDARDAVDEWWLNWAKPVNRRNSMVVDGVFVAHA